MNRKITQATYDNYELRDRLEELRITTQEAVSECDSLRRENAELRAKMK